MPSPSLGKNGCAQNLHGLQRSTPMPTAAAPAAKRCASFRSASLRRFRRRLTRRPQGSRPCPCWQTICIALCGNHWSEHQRCRPEDMFRRADENEKNNHEEMDGVAS